MNWELPDVQAGFRKTWGTRDQIANIWWIIKKAREFQKNIYFCFVDYAKAFVWITINKASRGDGIPADLFQILNDGVVKMLYSICQQIRNLSSGHRTRKGQFLFQPQRRAVPKNVQTTAQLHSFHMLAKQCSKFSKLGFNNMWTENFQMFKLVLEKAEEPEIKLPAFVGS